MRDQEPPTAHISVRHMCGRRWKAGERLATRSSRARDHSAHITVMLHSYYYLHSPYVTHPHGAGSEILPAHLPQGGRCVPPTRVPPPAEQLWLQLWLWLWLWL
jgi:hypothetical protein